MCQNALYNNYIINRESFRHSNRFKYLKEIVKKINSKIDY